MLKQFIFFVALILIAFSCEKATTLNEEEVNDDYLFMLNGKQVDEKAFTLNDDLFFVVTNQNFDSPSPNPNKFILHAYEEKAAFFQFGMDNNIPLKESHEYHEHLAEYAEANGIIEIAEAKGEIPSSFLTYQEQYYEQKFGRPMPQNRIFTTLFQDLNGGGDDKNIIGPGGIIWFLNRRWRNAVSSFEFAGVGGVQTVFDRSWYRDFLMNFWVVGNSSFNFNGPLGVLNDRAESWGVGAI